MSKNTIETKATGYNVNNMRFSEPIPGKIPGEVKMSYNRINITTKNPDGSYGDLIFPTEKMSSFGVKPTKPPGSDVINGYSMSYFLYDREGPTEYQKALVETLNNVTEHVKKYLLENKKILKKPTMDTSDFKTFNPLYYKKNEDGEILEGSTPSLYPKLLIKKEDGDIKILTKIYDIDTEKEINPKELLDVSCIAYGAIKIEGIYVGSKISLQVKLYEAWITPTSFGSKRLLSRPTAIASLKDNRNMSNHRPMAQDDEIDEHEETVDNDDNGSLIDTQVSEEKIEDEDENDLPPPPVAPKKIVKKIVKKVVKSDG